MNIGADDSVEYLLFFSDQGQVGAAIFDTQIASDMAGMVDLSVAPAETPAVALQSVPLQPLGSFRPYRLLPANWSYASARRERAGVLALPKDRERVLPSRSAAAVFRVRRPMGASRISRRRSC